MNTKLTIQNLDVHDAEQFNIHVLNNTVDLVKTFISAKDNIVSYQYSELSNTLFLLELNYKDFFPTLCVVPETYTKSWLNQSSYDKNYFCTYFFNGTVEEFDCKDHSLLKSRSGEFTITDSIVDTFPMYEIYNKCAWICFSSWKPLTADCLHISEKFTLPANIGLFVVLGKLFKDDSMLLPLDYIPPQQTDTIVTGNAKVVLIKFGQFTNIPAL